MDKRLIKLISEDVLTRLNLDEKAVFFLKIDMAKEYLNYRFPQDHDIIDGLLAHPAFWEWWNQLWAERDRKMLSQVVARPYGLRWTYPIGKPRELANGDSYVPSETRIVNYENIWTFYQSVHSPKKIQLFPNYQLINECLNLNAERKKEQTI